MKEPADCWLAEYINHVAAAATLRAPPSVTTSIAQYFTTGAQDTQLVTSIQHSSFVTGDRGGYVFNAPFPFLPGWSRVYKQKSLTYTLC